MAANKSTDMGVGSVGSWEKHTKGIGLKYLQKFGFKGRLGAKEDGVSGAIEVVVRPTNQGLGFGGVAEASTLKANKKIEAEWRGLEFIDDEEDNGRGGKRKKSSIEQMAESKSWKKGSGEGAGARTNTAAKQQEKFKAEDFIRKYVKLDNRSSTPDRIDGEEGTESSTIPPKQVIIDMRHKDTRIITDMHDISSEMDPTHMDVLGGGGAGEGGNVGFVKPKLGQELLYNINVIADMEEIRVNKDSRLLGQEVERLHRAKRDILRITASNEAEQQRLERLQKLSLALQRIDDKMNSSSGQQSGISGSADPVRENGITVAAVCSLFRTLHQGFSEEFVIFGLVNMLPFLLSRVIKSAEEWNPQRDHAYLLQISQELLPLVDYFQTADFPSLAKQCNSAFLTIVQSRFLPAIRRFVTSEWDAQRDPEVCVNIFQSLLIVLPPAMFDDTVDMILLPKLSATIAEWKPMNRHGVGSSVSAAGTDPTATTTTTTTPIHTWLHPWLPLLSSKLSALYPEIRRKMHAALSAWHPSQPDFALQLLRPWHGVFDASSMENLLLRAVLPKLVCVLREDLHINPQQQDIAPLQWVLPWLEILPPMHGACLLAGELMPQWLAVLLAWLTPESPASAPGPSTTDEASSSSVAAATAAAAAIDYEEICTWYSGWKSMIPVGLLVDELLLEAFDLALDMMNCSLLMAGESRGTSGSSSAEPSSGSEDMEIDDMDKNSGYSNPHSGSGNVDLSSNSMEPFRKAVARMQQSSCNYHSLVEQRKAVLRAQRRLQALEEEETRGVFKPSQFSAGGASTGQSSFAHNVSFKEVVDSFAQQHNVEFAPRIGKYHEGKQVWQFGSCLCYLDQNVVFVSSGSGKAASVGNQLGDRSAARNWIPMALEELLQAAT